MTRPCPPHRPPSPPFVGPSCCVAHYDGPNGTIGPACFTCVDCGHWIRPAKASEPCPDCVEIDALAAGRCPKGHELEINGDIKRCRPCRTEWTPTSKMVNFG